MSDKAIERLLRSGPEEAPGRTDSEMLVPGLSDLLRAGLLEELTLEASVMEVIGALGPLPLREGLFQEMSLEEGVMEALDQQGFSDLFQKALQNEVELADDVMGALSLPELPLQKALAVDLDLSDSIMSALSFGETEGAFEKEESLLGSLFEEGLSGEVDLSGGVMEALNLPDAGAFLREALGPEVQVDAGVMDSLEFLSSEKGLKEALSGEVDVSEAVMEALSIGSLGALMREGLSEEVDVRGAVMAHISAMPIVSAASVRPQNVQRSASLPVERPVVRPSRTMLRRWAPAIAAFASAAALVFAVVRMGTTDVVPEQTAFTVSTHNEAEVEDLTTSSTASAQVMKFDDDGPTFILVDEGETSNPTVPL